MTSQELKERIEKKQEQIKKIEKRVAKWEKANDEYELRYATRDLKEAQQQLAKYENMLQVELQKENSIDNLPELFNEFREYLIKNWDEFDIAKRDKIKQELKRVNDLSYEEYKQEIRVLSARYGVNLRDKAQETNEHIHQENVKASRQIILDLINRVSEKTGTITSFANLYLDYNNDGFTILNGYVVGEKGIAKVESVLAGGYNIQRLHIRVLVK